MSSISARVATTACGLFVSFLGATVVGAALTVSPAWSGEPVNCIHKSVTFDGIAPLRYAAVIGDEGSQLSLKHEYPTECSQDEHNSCPDTGFVMPGDIVAVGKSCGKFAYVQFIGKENVATGWLSTDSFSRTRKVSMRKDAKPNWELNKWVLKEPIFQLVRGSGLPVCEAYLQRLNQEDFDRPPFCGRPGGTGVLGFKDPGRVPFTNDESIDLAPWVLALTDPAIYVPPSDYDSVNANGGEVVKLSDSAKLQAQLYLQYRTTSWHFKSPIDINNDGKPLNIALWDWDRADNRDCGIPGGRTGLPQRTLRVGLVMTKNRRSIDQLQTIAVFGHPDGGLRLFTGAVLGRKDELFLHGLRLLGDSYGVFEFQDKFYIDTFMDASFQNDVAEDFDNKPQSRENLEKSLGVFLREQGKTRLVCEYSETR